MANTYFQFKQFTVHQEHCAMKVTTDGCLFGAWTAQRCQDQQQKIKDPAAKTALDIGTGTGLLSLMLAQKTNCQIDAIEIDTEACQQAQENFKSSPWPERINALRGDAKKFDFRTQYDIILSNPPFYENELRSGNTRKNKAHHDETLLLEELLSIIDRNLAVAGDFYLLLPYKRNNEIEKQLKKTNLRISHKTFVKQSTKHEPFRVMIAGKQKAGDKAEMTSGELAIKNERDQYTPEFTDLLKDYYLHL